MKPAQIVLVEDNPADVLLIRKALEESGIEHALTRFESGEDAIRVLCAETNGDSLVPDAILLDLNTPRTDGFAALHRFKEFPRLSGVPIAILTSSRDRKDKQRAAIQGARYIEKPSELNEFLTSIGHAVKEMLGSPPATS
ncbi:MAG: response regulator [Bryobacterales bacterium]|nr:response regulator [Bryobacterales bacterium]